MAGRTPSATAPMRDRPPARPDRSAARDNSALEVWWVFLRLGLTAFGGPVAHLGHFRAEFVERRRWIDDKGYADLVALCQFLPGPASSQVGVALGLGRASWLGALRAMGGMHAAVVGVLAAALYDPVWTVAIGSRAAFGVALAAFALLVVGRASPVWVVALGAAASAWLHG